jgi:NhaP-type Na+/H+ or K+/H+ antiporter
LATALSVPLLTAAGAPCRGANLVVFLAASTIILTLAVNGVSLPWFIRKLQAPGVLLRDLVHLRHGLADLATPGSARAGEC